MHHHSDYFRLNLSLAALSALVSLLGLNLSPASAQIETVVNFQAPPMDSPGNREAGGQRDDSCADVTDTTGLIALVPDTNIGLTTQASPNLFAYVPSNNAERAELRIFQEATGEEVFAGQVVLPENPIGSAYQYQAAIVSMPLLSGPVTLESDENYLWALMLVCNVDNRAADIVVDVVVQRVGDNYLNTLPPEVNKQLINLGSASKDEKLATYSSAGVWQDLLLELSALVQESSGVYGTTWMELLTNQGMGTIADAPIYESSLHPLNP